MLLHQYKVAIDGIEPAVLTAWCAPVADLLPGAAILDDADRAHAGRFRQQADRDRITAARILLRHALTGEAPEIAPEAWHFRTGPNGKPLMAEGLPKLHFNLSHAAEAVAVAVSTRHPVGIDIESIAIEDRAGIIPDMLTAREMERLAALGPHPRWREFMRIWTLKEACAKAMGLGMSYDFRRMEVAPESAAVTAAEMPVRTAATTMDCAGRPYALGVAWIDG
ncbi:MAG: 4'-phosphopantetheinyl transferase superfamily protein [Parvibaculaceae bacterium]